MPEVTSEPQTSQPEDTQIPTTKQCDAIPSDNLEHHILQSPIIVETLDNDPPLSSYPSSPTSDQLTQIHGPIYKPLTLDEIVIPSEQMLPLLENIMRQSVDINNSLEPPPLYPKVDIRKIIIKPLKRKRLEPKIPFNRTQPFFNPIFEPNLQLLTIAIDISLKRFKRMEEEALIFDSDVDAEARNLENKFAEAHKLLGGFVKSKIKGRGMEVLRTVMEKAEHSSAPRLTNFNHEEDQKLREQVFATIQEDVRRAFEEAKRLAEEEAEAARIASEERARKQAALNVTIDMLVRMAEVETQKLMDAQVMGPNPDRDIVMTEQVTPEQV
jgi:hypothetical protein